MSPPTPPDPTLDPWRERDACGVGFVARADGRPSHTVLRQALTAVARLAHRGAAAADASGDGAGVLTQLPTRLLRSDAHAAGVGAPGRPFAVGMFFLPQDAATRDAATSLVDTVLAECDLPALGWRAVPVDLDVLGTRARAACPVIRQVLIGRPAGVEAADAWERRLYVARRRIERRAADRGMHAFYCCSLSSRTVVYKALLNGTELAAFYADLRSPRFETALAVFHQRYSTNTLPSWPLAQPFQMLAHNGEINTLWGNRNAMRAREAAFVSRVWREALEDLKPVLWADGSDSANLDNALELLVRSGREPVHALLQLIPEAWEGNANLDPALRAFYEYHACLNEPWDGPTALAFSDGVVAGAGVDRNGLRPSRFKIMRDGLVVAASEVGVIDLNPADVVAAGRLGPGEVLVVDTRRGTILRSAEAKQEIATRRPWAEWVADTVHHLPTAGAVPSRTVTDRDALTTRLLAFGYGREDVKLVLTPMAESARDAVWSMGDDTPIPPLATRPPNLYAYLRQRFAQVTNPAIDPLREALVMSLRMHLGRRDSWLADAPREQHLVRIEHPVLLDGDLDAIASIGGTVVGTVDAVWPIDAQPESLLAALDRVASDAIAAARVGAHVIVVTDRAADHTRAPIPMLLAISVAHQALMRAGLRSRVGLVAQAGDAWDIHHLAVLFGYGAEAVHPWLALEVVDVLAGGADASACAATFRSAAEQGLRRILSKMGIATLPSYVGAQIFEALGLGRDVIERCLPGTTSVIGGIGFTEIVEDVLARHRAAHASPEAPPELPDYGRVRFRRNGEDHGWSPIVVRELQRAVAEDGREEIAAFLERAAGRVPATPRDLLGFAPTARIPLEQVEPVESIRRRFITSAMSFGALSPEAHTTLSVAMNRMGARSNSGEGGEDPDSYLVRPDGERRDNRIKQIASGRFGVTTEYVARADELEIKIAQGSKPGEGGHLPGHKVTALIARLRHAVPGISLISPPPHHDIYSIEDLAQLIHDLKQVNPNARIGVKLVAEAGVGTVAAGVAKAYADYVLISGHNGGTGASALSSIKHAGTPWELGLAETQAILMANGLRERVEVRVDGGFRTGRDVVIAALLGAESYGFGTAALVALGCDMARQCHLNTCPAGIATQRDDLRKKFRGTPEQVVRYFTGIAHEVRGLLAALGARRVDEIVGRVELLRRIDRPETPRAALLDLSLLLEPPAGPGPRRRTIERNVRPGVVALDRAILDVLEAPLARGGVCAGRYAIRNHHLTVGAQVAGRIARQYGNAGTPAPVRLRFRGSAGQSFGAFALPGMELHLEGEANDYVGKGLCGGEIAIRPFRRAAYTAARREHVLLGNTALYGATRGGLFAAGAAGDRFAVRNSGAIGVVEGAGDHCCEYMTGGTVVVLGPVGRNLGAGMSHGEVFVFDPHATLASRVNPEMVAIVPLSDSDARRLRSLIRRHARLTASPRARRILERWSKTHLAFRKVVATAVPVTPPAPHRRAPLPAARSGRA